MLSLLFIFVTTFGQNNTSTTTKGGDCNPWSITLSGGSMIFYGDLQKSIFPTAKSSTLGVSDLNWGYGLAVNKQLSPVFTVQGQLQSGKLAAFKNDVDAYFKTSITEYGFNCLVNLKNLIFPDKQNGKIFYYGVLGISLVDMKSLRRSISTGDTIHSYGYGQFAQKKKNTTETCIPFGLGVKYKINKNFDIGIETQFNYVNTAKLSAYGDPLDKKVQAGQVNRNKYGYTALTLTYKLGCNKKTEYTNPQTQPTQPTKPTQPVATTVTTNKKIDSLNNKVKEIENKTETIKKDIAAIHKADSIANAAKNQNQSNSNVANTQQQQPVATTNKNTTQAIPETSDSKNPVASITFKPSSSYIDALNDEKLASIAVAMLQDPTLKLEIVEYTDKSNNSKYVEALDNTRARAINYKLVSEFGIAADRISIKSVDDKTKVGKIDVVTKEPSKVTATVNTPTPTAHIKNVVPTTDYSRPLFSVLFNINSDFVDELGDEIIVEAVTILKQDSTLKLELVGNADITGGHLYNKLLSDRRAKSVSNKLINKYGINPKRISITALGDEKPLSATNYTINRRVDVYLRK